MNAGKACHMCLRVAAVTAEPTRSPPGVATRNVSLCLSCAFSVALQAMGEAYDDAHGMADAEFLRARDVIVTLKSRYRVWAEDSPEMAK